MFNSPIIKEIQNISTFLYFSLHQVSFFILYISPFSNYFKMLPNGTRLPFIMTNLLVKSELKTPGLKLFREVIFEQVFLWSLCHNFLICKTRDEIVPIRPRVLTKIR